MIRTSNDFHNQPFIIDNTLLTKNITKFSSCAADLSIPRHICTFMCCTLYLDPSLYYPTISHVERDELILNTESAEKMVACMYNSIYTSSYIHVTACIQEESQKEERWIMNNEMVPPVEVEQTEISGWKTNS